jgi:uncharacterized protein (TIGR03083 family)
MGTSGIMSEIEQLVALRASATRLRAIVEGFDAEQLRLRAYPKEWTVADVLSHLGSSGVIMGARLDAGLAGDDLADDFAQGVWDEWNAKTPDAKVADGLAVDRTLLEQFESLDDAERARVELAFGPVTMDFAGGVGARLNEHALHTWDVEVVLDPNATIPSDTAGYVVDNLGLIVQFAGKPTGTVRDIEIHTVDPARDFTLELGAETVSLAPTKTPEIPNRVSADLEMTAETLVRLVYGRLDPAHTPPVRGDIDLDDLRRAFPGV